VLFMANTVFAQTADSSLPSAPSSSQGQTLPNPDSAASRKNDSLFGDQLEPGEDPQNRLLTPFLKHLASDQKQFWTFPTRLETKDLKWILPEAGITATFIATDSWLSKQVPVSHEATSKKISDYGTYSFMALGAGSYLFGHMTNNDHLAETGLLAGEAALNAAAVSFAFREVAQRQRPDQGNGHGNFFAGGSSFPSMHSTIAWSIASVWAHEYPGWFSQMAAYGLASAVTLTRVTARQHFPSDVIIGSVLGWYFARQVYRSHHDPELGGSAWGSVFDDKTESGRNPNYMASPYVPVDSWIYPAMQRLIALGYIHSDMLGMRPWTRMACARLVDDAAERFPSESAGGSQGEKIYNALTTEFQPEIARLDGAPNVGAQVESVYTRAMGISGKPLRDGYHFGQTMVNDYGRPYWEGFNNVTGLFADAEAGPVSFYLRGEYQHAPAMPSYPSSVLAATAAADGTPPLANGASEANKFALLDSMASLNINNVQISFGTQSAWLGPTESGPWLMSNNARPFPMIKIDDVAPHEIPGLSRILGPFRTEFFVGQLSGHHWEYCLVSTCQSYSSQYPDVVGPQISPQPFIHGGKVSFQPTPNFEFGMGYTAMFGGPGLPVTFGNFFRTVYAHSSTASNNPGKRISAADFSYRIPGMRNWLTFYMDSLVVDEISPIGSTRASVNPGVYMPRLPGLQKMEFRAEGINESRNHQFLPGFVYYDQRRYLDGYANDGNLMGSAIGRAGRGVQGWGTYSFSPRNQLQFGYRLQTVSPKLIEGGRLVDYSAKGNFLLSHQMELSGLFQYEQWRFPIVSTTRQSDASASLQFTFYPKLNISRVGSQDKSK
jgi:hypothetical protein